MSGYGEIERERDRERERERESCRRDLLDKRKDRMA